jgi:hypothetical protein
MYAKDFFANPPAVEQQTCFVSMPFAPEFDEVYAAIKDAVKGPEVGFVSCWRADERHGGGHILDDVVDGIARAEVIIADVTSHNPNVFYELGIVHTVKDARAVIIITQAREEALPFNVRDLRCISYSPAELANLKQRVVDAILEVTPSSFRFTIAEAGMHHFRSRLRGPDGYFYNFDVELLTVALDAAEVCIVVRQWGGDARGNVVPGVRRVVLRDGYVEIPHLLYRLNLDGIVGDRAHFCVCDSTGQVPVVARERDSVARPPASVRDDLLPAPSP